MYNKRPSRSKNIVHSLEHLAFKKIQESRASPDSLERIPGGKRRFESLKIRLKNKVQKGNSILNRFSALAKKNSASGTVEKPDVGKIINNNEPTAVELARNRHQQNKKIKIDLS